MEDIQRSVLAIEAKKQVRVNMVIRVQCNYYISNYFF